jgi:bilirubin oxidase
MISRRRFIQTGLVLAALPKQMVWASAKVFRNTFRVPKLELGKRVGKDVYFDLSIQSGKSAILPNKITPTLGINQDFLGVTLFANQGDKVHISVKNTIDQTTTLHWHGQNSAFTGLNT